MITNIIENENYKNLVASQINDTINYLLESDEEFSITANIDAITFNPELPEIIKSKLSKYSLFTLSNYTYTTIVMTDTFISFEAGFGSENFGSTVKVPLHSIFQIVVDDSMLFINSVATVDKFNKNTKQNSMNVFMNNPNNKKFN